MKRKALKLSFFIIVLLCLLVTISELRQLLSNRYDKNLEGRKSEHFDPAFSRLNSLSKFENYCDSAYGGVQINASDTEQYAALISRTLRERFYHGYSYYSIGQNSFAFLFAPLIKKDLGAIVIPDDILKHPMAACSQQSIIGMEVFKNKGIPVRKVGFFADSYGGHFCFEAFFGGKWHFFDPDLEPKLSVMIANHFPSISELVKEDTLLQKLYFRRDKEFVEKLFFTYSYGDVNKFPAPRARFYQYATKFLSFTAWLLLLIGYFLVHKKIIYIKKKEKCVELQDSLAPALGA